MKEIIYLAISITTLSEPNLDGTPQVNVITHGYHQTFDECDRWRKDRYDHPWGLVDPITGQAVIEYLYECAVQFPDEVRDTMTSFGAPER